MKKDYAFCISKLLVYANIAYLYHYCTTNVANMMFKIKQDEDNSQCIFAKLAILYT